MPETLKKLREPAALAAVVFAGLVLLVGVINLLAPPGGGSVSFGDRAATQVGTFLNFDVALALVIAVFLANDVAPALAKARLITMIALVEAGAAALFGVISALALFGASGLPGEDKFLRFLLAIAGAAVIAVAGLYVWSAWQKHAAASPRPAKNRFQPGGAWQGGANAGAQQQPFAQPAQTPPPGGFGWTPQQHGGGSGAGQSAGPTAFGQQPQGQAPGQQPFGADRTQLLPPVQGGQGQQPPQPPQPQAQPPQPGYFGDQPSSGHQASAGAQQSPPQPPLPPTMQGYAPQQAPWSPGMTSGGAPSAAPQPPQPQQQIPPARGQEQDQQQRSGGPFQIGDWSSD